MTTSKPKRETEMTKNHITAVIDDISKSYAYAWLEQSHGYGHMMVVINLANTAEYAYNRYDGAIKISCQIGSGNFNPDQCEKPYAERYGFDARYGHGTLPELEAAVKVMKKVAKYLDKMYDEFGSPEDYAEFCQRILIGAGVKNLIVDPCHWAKGGALPHMDMVSVGVSSAHRLRLMEKELISTYRRIAA